MTDCSVMISCSYIQIEFDEKESETEEEEEEERDIWSVVRKCNVHLKDCDTKRKVITRLVIGGT